METATSFASLVGLGIIAVLAGIYARRRATVVLPAIMLGSLICRFLGLTLPDVVFKTSFLAGALIVFIAGLELDIHFIARCKEKIVLTAAIEIPLYLLIFYVVLHILPMPVAIALMAIMVASNEMFVLEVRKTGDEELAMYGIVISVIEDAFAVFLYTLGAFSSPSIFWRSAVTLLDEKGASLFILSVSVFILSLFLAKPMSRFMIKLGRKDTKVLLTLLYMIFLITLSEAIKLPEALVVFLGALALTFSGLDEETFEIMESYMILAVMCFVAALPYYIPGKIDLTTFVNAMMFGAALSVLAFALRFTILSVSSFLSGLPPRKCWYLAFTLANIGEFGLIVLSGLLVNRMLPQYVALAAMFAYGFNLSMMCVIAPNSFRILSWLENRVPSCLPRIISKAHERVVVFLGRTIEDPTFKEHVSELILSVSLIYVFSALIQVINVPVVSYVLTILVMSMFIISTYIVFQYISQHFEMLKMRPEALPSLFVKFALFYAVMYPVLGSFKHIVVERSVDFTSPIVMFSAFVLSFIMFKGVKRVGLFLGHHGERERSSDQSKVDRLSTLRDYEGDGEPNPS